MENSSSYYNFDQFNEMFQTNVFNGFNTLHLNISSFPYNFDQLETLLTTLKVKFDILGITEIRLKTGKQPINNIVFQKYVVESTTTGASCSDALPYINKNINYKLRKDFKIHKSKEVESIFIEIINKKERNTIIGCIYRHTCMYAREFNDTYLQNTLEKRSYENKDITLMGNFNIDILKYDTNNDSAAFLDMMYENFLLPYISSPTRVTPRSQTLIDNIFSNIIGDETVSGNITITISDHYAQFALFKNKAKSQKNKKIAKFSRNYKTFDKEMFDYDLKNTNWKETLKIERGDVDYSFRILNKKPNEILDKHAPFKKLSIQEEELSKKPWITTGILNSIKNKNRLYRKVIRAKDLVRITNLCNKCKLYRNKLDKILKASKSMHYQKHFEINKLNLRKTWEGIREVINIKKKNRQTINTLNSDNGIINEDRIISEQFKKHFCNIAKTIEEEISSAKKQF